ncbi:hypothetical protein M595_4830 [Lyngbya aestuarii BL J]|uniref:Uncharacterized protein n=1 Tax=Lyngbya aestuarii BL J TaxID=1348334 RepID=U7QBG3_9CYAN|nr:hypothetical protein M595_4830 [Lyngbya aestuarii BL J]
MLARVTLQKISAVFFQVRFKLLAQDLGYRLIKLEDVALV